jgi:hypothetical protein
LNQKYNFYLGELNYEKIYSLWSWWR